jgi:hypothetical protein
MIVLPLAEEGTTNEELHTSGRWPILVYNVDEEMKGNICGEINKYREINHEGSYILLISGSCV